MKLPTSKGPNGFKMGQKGVKRHPIAYRILINSLNESEGKSSKIMDNSKWKTIPTNRNIKS